MREGLGAGACRKSILVRPGGLVECGRELLRECAGNKAAKEVAHDNAPNSACRLADCYESPQAQGCGDWRRQLRVGKAGGHSAE